MIPIAGGLRALSGIVVRFLLLLQPSGHPVYMRELGGHVSSTHWRLNRPIAAGFPPVVFPPTGVQACRGAAAQPPHLGSFPGVWRLVICACDALLAQMAGSMRELGSLARERRWWFDSPLLLCLCVAPGVTELGGQFFSQRHWQVDAESTPH